MPTAARKTSPTKKRANFHLHAPDAREVFVAGSFNDWDPAARPLKKGSNGVFRTWMSLAPGTYEYRFVVDGQWQEDPDCQDQAPSPYGGSNSVLVL